MRHGLIAAATLIFMSPFAAAGLYVPGQPSDFAPKDGKVVAQPFEQFRLHLSDLMGIANPSPQPTELRRQYLAQRDELDARFRRLTAAELNRLGFLNYRLGDYEKALSAWQLASQGDRNNFVVYSHLALLELAAENFAEAQRYDSTARTLMPRALPGMSADQSAWYVKVEGKLRQLIRARAAERRQKVPFDQLTLDDLFGVQFVGEGGSYEPGRIAAAQREKLPEDAVAIVQQLLLWLPRDARLLWLLAELYNANGDPAAALALMRECVEARRFQPELLRAHRQVIGEHFAAKQAREEEQERSKRRTFWIAVIGGSLLALGLVAWQVSIYVRRYRRGA